jgi:hypothetical protein
MDVSFIADGDFFLSFLYISLSVIAVVAAAAPNDENVQTINKLKTHTHIPEHTFT